jgi:hypothetical protein
MGVIEVVFLSSISGFIDISFLSLGGRPATAGLKEGRNAARGLSYSSPDSDLSIGVQGEKASPACQSKTPASNRGFDSRPRLSS